MANGQWPRTNDQVVLSHLHGDHFGGVPFLLLDGLYATRRTRPLTIVGPPGVEARVLGTFELLFPGAVERLARAYSCRFVEYAVDGERAIIGRWSLVVGRWSLVLGVIGPCPWSLPLVLALGQ